MKSCSLAAETCQKASSECNIKRQMMLQTMSKEDVVYALQFPSKMESVTSGKLFAMLDIDLFADGLFAQKMKMLFCRLSILQYKHWRHVLFFYKVKVLRIKLKEKSQYQTKQITARCWFKMWHTILDWSISLWDYFQWAWNIPKLCYQI